MRGSFFRIFNKVRHIFEKLAFSAETTYLGSYNVGAYNPGASSCGGLRATSYGRAELLIKYERGLQLGYRATSYGRARLRCTYLSVRKIIEDP